VCSWEKVAYNSFNFIVSCVSPTPDSEGIPTGTGSVTVRKVYVRLYNRERNFIFFPTSITISFHIITPLALRSYLYPDAFSLQAATCAMLLWSRYKKHPCPKVST
jgi:hypothetical protein